MKYETTQFLVDKAEVTIGRAGMLSFFHREIKPALSGKYDYVHLAAWTTNEMRVVIHADNLDINDVCHLPKFKSIKKVLPFDYVVTFGD